MIASPLTIGTIRTTSRERTIRLQVNSELFTDITEFFQFPPRQPNRVLTSFFNNLSPSFRRGLFQFFDAGFPIIVQNQNRPSQQIIVTRTLGNIQAIGAPENFELLENPGWPEIGRALYREILENPDLSPTLENICMLIWAFMDVAEKKGAAFQEGTFTIEDPDQQLWNYLQPLGNPRRSSHLRGVTHQTILGIEIDNACDLPASHRHLLVHQYKDRQGRYRLLIKPEKHGLKDMSDTLQHGQDWAINTGKRIISKQPQKKGERKERIDSTLVRQFDDFTDAVTNFYPSSPLVRPILNDLNTWGVQVMYDYLQQAEFFFNQLIEETSLLDSDWDILDTREYFVSQVQNFLRQIEMLGDHLDQRFASEVIISQKEMLKSSSL